MIDFYKELEKVSKEYNDLSNEINKHKKLQNEAKNKRDILEQKLTKIKMAIQYIKGEEN